jgi:hypothetical protein
MHMADSAKWNPAASAHAQELTTTHTQKQQTL